MQNKQFPIGDVTDAHKDKAVNEWFESIEKMDHNQFRMHVQINHKPTVMVASTGPYKNYNSAAQLCRKWDEVRGDNRHFAATGYIVAMAFNQRTNYLPSPIHNLSVELAHMHDDADPQSAPNFARTAWYGMSTYPRVFGTYERLYEHSRSRYDIVAEENSDYFLAGMMLPYILASASRLIGYTPEFKGLKGEKYNLQTTDFNQFFTNDVELAPDVIIAPERAEEES